MELCYQYSTELEQSVSCDREFDTVPQRNRNTITLCNTEVLETVGQGCGLRVQIMIRETNILVL